MADQVSGDSTDNAWFDEWSENRNDEMTASAMANIGRMLEVQLPSVQLGGETFGMDGIGGSLNSAGDQGKINPIANQILSEGILSFFAAQSFIGYQVSSLLAQNWLIDKACTVKVRDAIKNWYVPTINDGKETDEKLIAYIVKADKRFKLKKNLLQAGRFNNIFGIRHVLFEIDSSDPMYYEKPFNPDGITEGSYKGMTQIDPYWMTPFLTQDDVASPASQNFYEPTHWVVSGTGKSKIKGKIHHSHFVILRGPELSDFLKPGYYYGGLSLAQRIFERVYAAERTANEVPQIAMTKRLNVRKVDLEKVAANQGAFEMALNDLVRFRDSFGVHVIDKDEEHQQFDTSLTDYDSALMSQYQLCAAIANVPATKLINTSPKGFNATGEFEIDTYHEELESIQEMEMDDIVERHHLCLMKSEVKHKFGNDYEIEIVWNPLSVESRKEKAEINKINAETIQLLVDGGTVDQSEARDRLINDPNSGWDGLESMEPEELGDLTDIEETG